MALKKIKKDKTTPNDKQKRFCQEYSIDFNATQAAIRAGYSKKNAKVIAAQLLKKPEIKKYIKTLTKKTEDKLEISREHIAKNFLKIADKEADGVIVKTSDVIKANEQLGKLFGLYEVEKVNITGTISLSALFDKAAQSEGNGKK